MTAFPDQMIRIHSVPVVGWAVGLPVYRDYDTAVLDLRAVQVRLDLDGIGQLQVALDRAVEAIRAYQDRQAAGDA